MSTGYLRQEYLIMPAECNAAQVWLKINMSYKHRNFVEICNSYQTYNKTEIKQTSIKETE